jgi:ribonuclease P/MRP protein subunit RPP1
MQCIDGCVFPFPAGTHSVARIISELRGLGFTGAVVCNISEKQIQNNSFSVFPARYITGPSLRDIQKEIQAALREKIPCLVRAGDEGMNRVILTTPGVRILCDLHTAPKNSFDRVCAQSAAEREIAVDIRISPLCELRGVPRQRVIRLYEEILLLQNRYEFPLVISSGAFSPAGMRSPRAMNALLTELGMEKGLIEQSFATFPELIRDHSPVQRVF